MHDKAIILRYGELHLKGKNRAFFENLLIKNIKAALGGFELKLSFERSRYIVSDYAADNENIIINALKFVFGLHSLSIAEIVKSNLDDINAASLKLVKSGSTFRVNTNRADKTFPLDSMQISREVGAYILSNANGVTVDLHNPDCIVCVDVRENGKTFVYSSVEKCAGGMPVGSGGKGMLMLSGGIDSPVAGFMMAKRGMTVSAVHFCSPPYTSEFAKMKVIDLAHRISLYTGRLELLVVPFTKIQEAIHKNCEASFMIVLMRRAMMRISNALAKKRGCDVIITGESLGQVASQTVQSITATNIVSELPVFRPLIGFDKNEIIDIAEKIQTFKISIQPHDDCCTVFLPEHPQTKPRLDRVLAEENKYELDLLIEEAVRDIETHYIYPKF